jgi:hypothetical protein
LKPSYTLEALRSICALRTISALKPSYTLEALCTISTLRAVNLARMRAESINGGLIVYRAQRCMFEDNGGPCLISRDANGLLFRFLGGPPGWQEQNQPATLETEILISPDGRQVLNVVYNGKPRPTN